MTLSPAVLKKKVVLIDGDDKTTMTLQEFLDDNDGDESVVEDVEEWASKGMRGELNFGGGSGPDLTLRKVATKKYKLPNGEEVDYEGLLAKADSKSVFEYRNHPKLFSLNIHTGPGKRYEPYVVTKAQYDKAKVPVRDY